MSKPNSENEKPAENEDRLEQDTLSNSLTENSESSQVAKLPEPLESLLPEEVKEVMPTSIKKDIAVALSLGGRRSASPLLDLSGKVEPSHITQFLENDAAQDERSFRDSQITKRYMLVYVLIFCALFVFVTVFLVDRNVSIYSDLLKIVLGFAGGFGSGLGYKNLKDGNKKG